MSDGYTLLYRHNIYSINFILCIIFIYIFCVLLFRINQKTIFTVQLQLSSDENIF